MHYDLDMPSYDLWETLIRDTGVMLTPGVVMNMEGTLRVGFGNDTASLENGLPRLTDWFAAQRT